jgi:hypothetical protein
MTTNPEAASRIPEVIRKNLPGLNIPKIAGLTGLSRTVLDTKDGAVYFPAESTGFPLSAVAGTLTGTVPAVPMVAAFGSTVQEQATTRASAAKVQVTPQTTAPR